MYLKARCLQQGMGLPAAIFVIVILAMVTLAITELDADSAESVVFDVQSTRAFLAATSGVQVGLNQLFPPALAGNDCTHAFFSASPSLSFNSAGLQNCTATVSCTLDTVNGEQFFALVSEGRCGSNLDLAERAVEVRVR